LRGNVTTRETVIGSSDGTITHIPPQYDDDAVPTSSNATLDWEGHIISGANDGCGGFRTSNLGVQVGSFVFRHQTLLIYGSICWN
jgi:hypothetical protein